MKKITIEVEETAYEETMQILSSLGLVSSTSEMNYQIPEWQQTIILQRLATESDYEGITWNELRAKLKSSRR